jgi:hypothetical protein
VLTGELGIEGGVYPGGFHPTAGSVEVEWQNPPIALDQRVGKNGHFRISLPPGTYTVVGCGPTASSSPVPQCSKPRKIKLSAGETDHIRLVWALVP